MRQRKMAREIDPGWRSWVCFLWKWVSGLGLQTLHCDWLPVPQTCSKGRCAVDLPRSRDCSNFCGQWTNLYPLFFLIFFHIPNDSCICHSALKIQPIRVTGFSAAALSALHTFFGFCVRRFFRISTIEYEYLDLSSQFIVLMAEGFTLQRSTVVEPSNNAKNLKTEIPVSLVAQIQTKDLPLEQGIGYFLNL